MSLIILLAGIITSIMRHDSMWFWIALIYYMLLSPWVWRIAVLLELRNFIRGKK